MVRRSHRWHHRNKRYLCNKCRQTERKRKQKRMQMQGGQMQGIDHELFQYFVNKKNEYEIKLDKYAPDMTYAKYVIYEDIADMIGRLLNKQDSMDVNEFVAWCNNIITQYDTNDTEEWVRVIVDDLNEMVNEIHYKQTVLM